MESSAPVPAEQIDPSASGILRAEFGENWRWWRWLQRQFSVTSLGTIAALLVAGGGYIVHLRESVVQVRERVVVLETKVIPFVEGETRIATLETVLNDHGARITRLESNWDEAKSAAAAPPIAGRRRLR